MGERDQGTLFHAKFNRSIVVEPARSDITADAGAILARVAAERVGLTEALAGILDPRDPFLVKYPMADLLLSKLIFTVQGWHDQDDLDTLRDDPAFRASVNTARGEAVAARTLPSQPTMSRTLATLSTESNRDILAAALLEVGLRRASDDLSRSGEFTIDLDSFPLEVHGKQENSRYNGHYHSDCYHPLAAFSGTGDILALELRPGNVHTAEGVRPFVEPVIRAASERFSKVWARFDAGYASGEFFDWLDERRVRFITRLKSNAALLRSVKTWKDRTIDRWRTSRIEGSEPREATFEFWYKAGTWTQTRRVVAVLVERSDRDGELFESLFFLCTNASRPEATSARLLARYRERGRAENHIGEFVNEHIPNLSSPSFAANEAALRLAGLAYDIAHYIRRRIEKHTGEGLSLKRLRERILKAPARLVRHARRLVFRVAQPFVDAWQDLAVLLERPIANLEGTVA